MRNLFGYDSKLIQKLNFISDLMILNVLTVLCSIPIVTMGAAITALYDAIWRMQEGEGKLPVAFWNAFKSNFKKSTIIWLIFLPLGLLIAWNFNRVFVSDQLFPVAFSLFAVLWWAFSLAWVFPMQSRFENTIWGTIKNSLMLPLGYFPRTLLMAFLNLFPWILLLAPDTGSIFTFTLGGLIWVLIYFAAVAYINMKLMGKAFDRFFAQAAADEE